MLKKFSFAFSFCLLFLLSTAAAAPLDQPQKSLDQYQLKKVLMLSRHNLRAPISTSLSRITPHQWFSWTAAPGELSVRGGEMETSMGQYFRKLFVKEGFLTENEKPQKGTMRFYANSLQRTIATTQYFSTGLLPVANVSIEHHMSLNEMDPVFTAKFTFMNDAYHEKAMQEIAAKGNAGGILGITRDLADSYRLIEQVLDAAKSPAAIQDGWKGFRPDDTAIILEQDHGPYVLNSLQSAIAASDALVLQYYEEENLDKAAFHHKLTEKDWEDICRVKDTGMDVLCTAPSVAINIAHPLLQVMQDELSQKDRKLTFLCGHDSNLASVLAALDIKPYSLPQTIEKKTPIGAKFIIEKWQKKNGEEYASLSLVYPSTRQIRQRASLSLETPPVIYPLTLNGLEKNADGFYRFRDVQKRFQEAIDAYDTLKNMKK